MGIVRVSRCSGNQRIRWAGKDNVWLPLHHVARQRGRALRVTARKNEIDPDALAVDAVQFLERDNKGFNPRARFQVIGASDQIPTRGIRPLCCARAAYGNAAALPTPRNCRRFMSALKLG